MSERQLYRLRAPSTGRELLLPAEPGKVYTDHDTGEPLEVVGKVLPLHPSKSQPAMGRRDAALLQLVRPAGPEGPERLPHVRPPYGRAAPLRGGRMRLTATRLAVPIIVLALLAGCGGAQVTVKEVPGGPVELTVPGNGDGARPAPRDAPRRPPTPTEDADRRRRRPRHADARRRAPTETPARHRARRPTRAAAPRRPPDDGTGDRPAADPGASEGRVRGLLRAKSRAPAEPALPGTPLKTRRCRLSGTPSSGKAQSTAHRTGHQG